MKIKVFLSCFFILSVTTLFSQATDLKFAVLTDLHIAPDSDIDKSMNEAIENINVSDYEFVIVSGDLTNVGSDAELNRVKNNLEKLKIPYYVVPGNHETNWSQSAGLTINKLFGDDKFVFEYKNYIFIGYSTGPYMKMSDGAVKKEDIIWIEKQLEQRYSEDKKIISVAHYPLAEGLSNWKDVTKVLKKYDCKFHINGHHHNLKLVNYDSIPALMAASFIVKEDTKDAVYNEIIFKSDSVKINTRSKLDNWEPKAYKNFSFSDTLHKVGEKFAGDYKTPQKATDGAFSYYEPATIFTGLVFSKDTEVVYYTNSLGEIKALKTSDKKELWSVKTGNSIYSTPFISGNNIIVGLISGDVKSFDIRTGKQVWSFNLGYPIVGEGVCDDKGNGYIGGSLGEFVKFSCKTGKIIWKKTPAEGLIQARPTIEGDKIIFGAWDKYLYALNTKTGQTIWKWTNLSPQKLYSPGNVTPLVANDMVFIVAPDRYFTAIDLQTGKQLYRTNKYKVRESISLSKDGKRIYAKTMNDVLVCFSTSERDRATTLWESNCEYGYEHTPCPSMENQSGNVLLTNRKGQVFAVDGKSGEFKWKFDAGNSAANKITEAPDKSLWISFVEGRIISFIN